MTRRESEEEEKRKAWEKERKLERKKMNTRKRRGKGEKQRKGQRGQDWKKKQTNKKYIAKRTPRQKFSEGKFVPQGLYLQAVPNQSNKQRAQAHLTSWQAFRFIAITVYRCLN